MFKIPRTSLEEKSSRQAVRRRSGNESVKGPNVFLRNRTLTGSASDEITSANEYRANIQSPRAKLHHLNFRRRKLILALLYVIFCLAVMLWLIYEFTGRVEVSVATGIQTSRDFQANKENYIKAVKNYLNAHPIERLRFMLRNDDLLNYVTAISPEINRINTAQASEPATSQFQLNFRKPVASWLIDTQQYFVDKDGIAFQVNYFEQPRVKIIDNNATTESNGNAVASIRFLRFVGRTIETSRALGLTVEQVTIPQGTTRQLEILIRDKQYPVKMSLDRPVGEQVEDMQKAISFIDSQNLGPKYIDVRVSGKAFYKM